MSPAPLARNGTIRYCTVLFGVLRLASAAANSTPHVPNFGQVEASVYRGGEPSPDGLQELKNLGIKVIIDLREPGSATNAEQQRARELGLRYTNIPFSAWAAPTPAKVEQVLSALEHANALEPVFVHCRRGKDRTGTVIACYRIQHDGWDNQRALAEANRFGMSHAERAMRAFVLRFSPLPSAPLPAASR